MKKPVNPNLPLPGIRWRGFTLQFFLITVLPLTALLLVIVFISQTLHHRAMINLVGDRNLRAARAASETIGEQLHHRIFLLGIIAAEIDSGADLSERSKVMTLVQDEFDGGIGLFSMRGEFTGGEIKNKAFQDLPRLIPDFWEAVVNETAGNPVFGALTTGQAGFVDVEFIGMRLTSGQILVGGFSPNALLHAAQFGSLSGGQASLFIVDADRRVILARGRLADDSALGFHTGVTEALVGESGINIISSEHSDHVVAFSPVPYSGWALVLEETWQDISTPFLSTTQSAPLILVPLLLMALAALWFGARQIVHPLQQLEEQTARLERGDFSALKKPVGGILEIRRLQDGLVSMAEELQSTQTALHGYIGAVTASVENERLNLARELHDDTLQALIAFNQRLQLTSREIASEEEVNSLVELAGLTQKTIQNLRRLVRGLRPIYLEDLGLQAALEMLCNEIQPLHGWKVEFNVEGVPRRLGDQVELALYRISQEALNNIAHHAQAGNVRLQLSFGVHSVMLMIEDDGVGFEAPATRDFYAREGHYGLLGMAERAELISAKMEIDSSPGKGTRITVSLQVD